MFEVFSAVSMVLISLMVLDPGTALNGHSSLKVKRDAVVNDELLEKTHNCKCVKHFLCDDDNYIITDGSFLIDIRNRFQKIHKFVCQSTDQGVLQYCCFLRNQEIGERFEPNSTSSSLKCGQRTIQKSSLTAEAQNGEYPWMAAIYVLNHFVCTGALIHPNVVLTAAHYVYRVKDKSKMRVFVGGGIVPRSKLNEERKVMEFLIHPSYVPDGNLHNDISLLILDRPYILGDQVNVLCLPTLAMNFQNIRCEISGWNRKDPDGLHKVSVPYVDHDQCQYQLRTYTELGQDFNLHDSFICAGGEKGKDVCKGDGGSPLMCKRGEEFYFVGIVSWGKGCNQENVPGAYTNVAKYMEWIYNETFKRNIIII